MVRTVPKVLTVSKDWRPRPSEGLPDGLILFDGVCVLCSGMVNFVMPRDPKQYFRFVAIQSEAGQVLAQRFGIDAKMPETVAVTSGGQVHFKSDSAIAISRELPNWRWVVLFRLLPRPVRDFLYDRVARNRYRLFGRRESCMMPTAGIRSRFIDRPAQLLDGV